MTAGKLSGDDDQAPVAVNNLEPAEESLTAGFTELPYRPWPEGARFSHTRHPGSRWLDLMHIRGDGARVYLCSKPA